MLIKLFTGEITSEDSLVIKIISEDELRQGHAHVCLVQCVKRVEVYW